MPPTFEPRLDVLPESQRRLWPELDAVPDAWVQRKGDNLRLEDPRPAAGSRVQVASLIDLAGMKMRSFKFGELEGLLGMQRDLTRWAQAVDLAKLPAVHTKPGLSPGGLER